MATKKVTIEVEVPEELSIGKDRLEGIARAILFEVAAQDISKLLKPSEEEVREVIGRVRRGLRSPHQ
ncbi:MAG: hypothetical protein F7C38_06000 [Desulfurococcales archaeon]|nr:hypothetical protein [Desulfurococcales archaeon]